MRKRFPIFIVLAYQTILLSFLFFGYGMWSNSDWSTHLRVSSVYYLALGVIYIFAFFKCKKIYIYIYVYPIAFLLQLLCFIRLKYTVITYYSTMFYELSDSTEIICFAVILNIIMLIGCIQYFIVLRRHNKDKKIKKG